MRSFDAAAFRQAAQMLDQVDAARLAALTPLERAQKLSAQARAFSIGACCWRPSGFISRLWPPTATALRPMPGWPRCASAPAMPTRPHGGPPGPGTEARADAYLVLGRLDLAANHLSEASNDAAAALKLEPASQAAQELARQVQAKAGH